MCPFSQNKNRNRARNGRIEFTPGATAALEMATQGRLGAANGQNGRLSLPRRRSGARNGCSRLPRGRQGAQNCRAGLSGSRMGRSVCLGIAKALEMVAHACLGDTGAQCARKCCSKVLSLLVCSLHHFSLMDFRVLLFWWRYGM